MKNAILMSRDVTTRKWFLRVFFLFLERILSGFPTFAIALNVIWHAFFAWLECNWNLSCNVWHFFYSVVLPYWRLKQVCVITCIHHVLCSLLHDLDNTSVLSCLQRLEMSYKFGDNKKVNHLKFYCFYIIDWELISGFIWLQNQICVCGFWFVVDLFYVCWT